MHPDPPSSWRINIREMDSSRKKSFDDQYLDELKTLRDPNYRPEEEVVTISVPKYLDASYLNMIRDFTENLYADSAEL